jgi:hypothetical protein
MRTSALSIATSASVFGMIAVFGMIGARFNVAPIGVAPSLCRAITICKSALDAGGAAAGGGIVDTAVAATDDVEVIGVAVAVAVDLGGNDTTVAAAVEVDLVREGVGANCLYRSLVAPDFGSDWFWAGECGSEWFLAAWIFVPCQIKIVPPTFRKMFS